MIKFGIKSTSPNCKTVKILSDKLKINSFCQESGIPVPKIYNYEDIVEDSYYFVKPILGYGSKGAQVMMGKRILEEKSTNKNLYIFQEVCNKPEITVEVFTFEKRYSFVIRERIETKAGVSVKARFIPDDYEIRHYIDILQQKIDFPIASCIQFMKCNNRWALTDFNLRMGAGTAMSSAIGWDLTSALLSALLGKYDPFKYLNEPSSEKIVARIYQEIVMK